MGEGGMMKDFRAFRAIIVGALAGAITMILLGIVVGVHTPVTFNLPTWLVGGAVFALLANRLRK